MQQVVADVYSYSQRYVRIAFAKAEDKEINAILRDINTLKVDVAYPFLLELYDDYDQGRLTREEFIEALKLVESYVFRRAICGIPTNSLNKTFATLGRELDKSRYLESVKAAFLLKESYRHFPLDDEFRHQLIIRDVYNLRNRNYLLRKLENHERKELVDVESYTIEHVMPQNENLRLEWQQKLGDGWREVQTKHLHTIGNLTLTDYNSEMSDRPSQEKRDMEGGFRDSPIRLNRTLAKLEHWNAVEIEKRAQELADLAVKIWAAPILLKEVVNSYRKASDSDDGSGSGSLESLTRNLQPQTLELFEELRKHILNLDTSVREHIRGDRAATYKTIDTNFALVRSRQSYLQIKLLMKTDEVIDPKGLCSKVTSFGTVWADDWARVMLSSPDQLEDVIALIRQAFDKHSEDGGA
jgi:predicted transport protein